MPSPRNRWNEFLSRTPFGTGISYSPAANSPEKSGCLRIRCTASLNFIKKLLGSLPDGWAYIDWIVCKLFFAIFRYFLQKEGKRIIIFSSSLRRVFDKIRQKRINSKHRIVGWKEWKGGESSSCSGIFMKSISIRRNAEWIWIQVRGVRLGDDRRATISWNFAGERYSAELAKHLTNMKAFKQRGSRATIPPPTSKEMPNRVSLKCSSQLGEQSGRTWNYLGIAQTESSPGISLVPSYGNLISIYDYNFSSIFYRILFLNTINLTVWSFDVPWILLLDS